MSLTQNGGCQGSKVDKFKRTPVSVFGSTGFLGSHYTKKSRLKTIAIPRNQRHPESNEILYLIGTVHNYNVFDDVFLDIDTNLRILVETLEHTRLSRPNAVFNYVSTWFVYGLNEIPFKETQLCEPRGFYSITKFAGELLLRSFCDTHSMRYRIIRLGNIIGPGDKKASLKKNAVQHMANMLLRGEDIDLYEDGDVIRDFLHVDDAVRGLDLILEKGEINEIYNLASGQGIKIGELLNRFKHLVGSKANIRSINTPAFHSKVQSRDSILDISKLNELGFSITRPITEQDLLDR